MADDERDRTAKGTPPAEQQGDGQPENERELADQRGFAPLDENGLGGTSDAGGAADEAAERAAFGIGSPDDDRTRPPR